MKRKGQSYDVLSLKEVESSFQNILLPLCQQRGGNWHLWSPLLYAYTPFQCFTTQILKPAMSVGGNAPVLEKSKLKF